MAAGCHGYCCGDDDAVQMQDGQTDAAHRCVHGAFMRCDNNTNKSVSDRENCRKLAKMFRMRLAG